VVLVNTAGPVNPGGVAAALAERLLGKVAPPVGQPFSRDFAPFAGTWRGVGRGVPLQLTTAVDSTGPTVRMGSGGRAVPLRYLGGDSFEAGNNRYTFLRRDQQVVQLRFDGVSVVSTLDRVP
jgi:hypothetical protein